MSANYHDVVRPGVYVVLQLPSDVFKPVQLKRNETISIGKFGSFHSDSVIGRPYHLTYEILDKEKSQQHPRLRIVPVTELNEEAAINDFEDENSASLEDSDADGVRTPDIVAKNNRLTVDEPGRQQLSMQQIEDLKKETATGSGKNIITQIMAAHSALDEKTAYSLAKYALRKTKKYMRRFTVLPMTVASLTDWVLAKDATKIMDLRHEILGLMTSWANVHHAGNVPNTSSEPELGGGRWLVVDDTGGLIVAAIAEKMGILYPSHSDGTKTRDQDADSDAIMANGTATPARPSNPKDRHQSAVANTITLVHPHGQPNLAMLRHFGYLPEDSSSHHPLYAHLHTLSWLQLLDPTSDPTYADEPRAVPAAELATWKSGRRSGHFRKRRRWERARRVADRARGGGFDGLVVATTMRPETVMRHLVPLVKGGGHVVAYSPTVEPLAELMDYYSRERRAAFAAAAAAGAAAGALVGVDPDFPLDPMLVLLPSLQTVRAVEWQVLPNRTHPVMISRGGAEGYVFTTTRVLPSEARAVARGKFSHKKRKAEADTLTP